MELKIKCFECKGSGEIDITVFKGEEGMKIEMDIPITCPKCEGQGWQEPEPGTDNISITIIP